MGRDWENEAAALLSDTIDEGHGSCYCGRVRYVAHNFSRGVTECHCSICRKQSGYRYGGSTVRQGDVTINNPENVTWFRASDEAERGFCATCGSHMFWRSMSDDEMLITAASLDEPTALRLVSHIFVGEKGGYYDIADDVPQLLDYNTPVD